MLHLLAVMLVFSIALGALAFWVWMIVDCATRETDPQLRLVWMLVILFAGIIGAPIYFFVRVCSRPEAASRPGPAPAAPPQLG